MRFAQFIGIDVGRDKLKIVTANKKIEIKSKVGEWRDRKLSTGGNYEVEIDGKRFFVSDLAEESYFVREMATESKIHQETKILFLTALHLISDNSKKKIITTGLPVIQHTKEVKNELLELLEGIHHVKVNNDEEVLVVNNLGIVPESGGAYWNEILSFDGKIKNAWLAEQKVRVVDIGSRTVNYCTINQRRYLDRDSDTLNYGVLELKNAEEKPSDNACEQFTRRIVADLSKRWLNYNPDNDVILLAGGGALLLNKWLKYHFPLAQIADDPVFANATGFMKMGVAKWGVS